MFEAEEGAEPSSGGGELEGRDAGPKARVTSLRETKGRYLRLTWVTVELLGVASREWVAQGLSAK